MTDNNETAKSSADRARWLEAKYTELASLAGGLAHEIKNPLSTLNLNLQLLAEDLQDAETDKERRARDKIAKLHQVVERLESLLNDFLRFARVSNLRREPTDLSSLAREMIDFYAPQAQVAGIVTRDDLPDGLPPVLVDKDMVKQALFNLMLNAQHAMPNGGELILKTRAQDGWVCLDVIDTGVGMAPDLLDKVFQPFFSTRPGGSGLGLPTTKRIIEAQGGKLIVQSEPGKGTAFKLRWPIAGATHTSNSNLA